MRDLVFICSPLSGNINHNLELARYYTQLAEYDGKLPITPHLYFSTFLKDTVPADRIAGIRMGLQLLSMCDEIRVYGDEVSEGMLDEINEARKLHIPITIHNQKGEVLTYDNYFIHREIGPGLRRVIETLHDDRLRAEERNRNCTGCTARCGKNGKRRFRLFN